MKSARVVARRRCEEKMATNEKTSPKVARQASKILRNPKSSPAARSVAASALTQARDKKPTRK
jgi:hypothetical protein